MYMDMYFQTGKLAEDTFSVDWCHPLSPLAALGITLAVTIAATARNADAHGLPLSDCAHR